MSAIKRYAKMVKSQWGSGDISFSDARPDPYSVLADETRMAMTVLLSLKGPLTAKQIADELDLAPSTVLAHIEKLLRAMVIKEVEVPEKNYKRERYYDIDVVFYYEDEEKGIDERIGKYADILNDTARVIVDKAFSDLSPYLNKTLMARHGKPMDRDEIKHLIWLKLTNMTESFFSIKKLYKLPLDTEKKYYVYIKLRREHDLSKGIS